MQSEFLEELIKGNFYIIKSPFEFRLPPNEFQKVGLPVKIPRNKRMFLLPHQSMAAHGYLIPIQNIFYPDEQIIFSMFNIRSRRSMLEKNQYERTFGDKDVTLVRKYDPLAVLRNL